MNALPLLLIILASVVAGILIGRIWGSKPPIPKVAPEVQEKPMEAHGCYEEPDHVRFKREKRLERQRRQYEDMRAVERLVQEIEDGV